MKKQRTESKIYWTVPSGGSFSEIDKLFAQFGWTVSDFELFLEMLGVTFPIQIGIFNFLDKSFVGVTGTKIWKFQLSKEESGVIKVCQGKKTWKYKIQEKSVDNENKVALLV